MILPCQLKCCSIFIYCYDFIDGVNACNHVCRISLLFCVYRFEISRDHADNLQLCVYYTYISSLDTFARHEKRDLLEISQYMFKRNGCGQNEISDKNRTSWCVYIVYYTCVYSGVPIVSTRTRTQPNTPTFSSRFFWGRFLSPSKIVRLILSYSNAFET